MTTNVDGNGFTRTEATGIWGIDPGVIIDHCLFQNTDLEGNGEPLIVKFSGPKIRFCTFENIHGYIQQRIGGGWELRSCWFEMPNGAPVKCWDQWLGGEEIGGRR